MGKKALMSGTEFNEFFNQVIKAAISPPGTKDAPETLLDVMEKHGLSMTLPPLLEEKLMPMLKSNLRGTREIEHNCSWCGVCGLCSACGELNAASIGAASAAAVHVLD
ncbi:MAG TPA: hypothetical protein VI298_03950 [Geobacteraceae bacterium]